MKLPDTEPYKLISVDIFDTLLLRAVAKPIDLFEIVWKKACEKDINRISMYPKEFMKLRVEMERRARVNAVNREVTLDEIYAQFPDFIVNDIGKIKELEIACEKEYCYPNPILLKWMEEAKKQGKKIALVSDMYLNSEELRELLQANEIPDVLYDEIIVSNEYHLRKQDGALFDILFQHYPEIKPEEMLHIGDNKNSDYTQPIQRGMQAFYYDVIGEHLYSIFDYEKIRHNVPQPALLSLRKLCMEHTEYTGKEKTAYQLGSAVIGPVLSLYAAWACMRMQKLGISRIYPLMREGYLLGKLLEAEAQNIGFSLLVHPIYISRKVTYLPSITEVNREEIENMIGARNLTVGESITLMGLDQSTFSEIREYFDVKYKQTHQIAYQESTLKEYIIQKYLEEQNVQTIKAYIKEERKKLITYLQQEIGDLNDVATIDIGFFGRIQMWMEKCLDIEGISHRMKHFLATGFTGDRVFDGMDYEGMFGTFAENQDLIQTIFRTPEIVEKLISVPVGSTIGYQWKNSRVVQIQDAGVKNEEMTRIVFEGILNFQKMWFSFRRMKPQIADSCIAQPRDLLKLLHRLIDMPRKEEVETLADFEADTNFGTNYKKGIITKDHIELAKEKGIDFIDKCNVSYTYHNNSIFWPKGVVTLMDEFYYVRRALKNGSQNDIIKSMQEVVEKVQEDGIDEVALYGAGENGRQFFFLCQMYHIKVNCFVDRKESLWGTLKEGIEVMGLDEVIKKGCNNYVVTSLFSISEIADFIRERTKDSEEHVRIYTV